MKNGSLTLHYRISKSDYYDFNMYVARRKGLIGRPLLLLSLIFIIGMFLLTLFAWKGLKTFFEFIPLYFFILIVLVAVRPLTALQMRWAVHRLLQGTGAHILEPSELRVSADEISEVQAGIETKSPLTGLYAIARDKKKIYIFMDNIRAFIVPDTAFPDEKSIEDFVEYISAKIAAP